MDHRAVIALVVVLGEDLPVGRGVVGVPPGDLEPLRLVGRDQAVERAQRVGQRLGLARAVHEDQPVPVGHGQLGQTPGRRFEADAALEPGSEPQAAGQLVRPRVVRADDRVALGRGPAGQQLVAAMAAGVGERVQHAIVVAGEQHAPGADRLGPLVARLGQLGAEPDAGPAGAEEMLLLPREHRRIHVGRAGQHHGFAEGLQRPCEVGRVDGGSRKPCLTDHTVKGRRDTSRCPEPRCPERPGLRATPSPRRPPAPRPRAPAPSPRAPSPSPRAPAPSPRPPAPGAPLPDVRGPIDTLRLRSSRLAADKS